MQSDIERGRFFASGRIEALSDGVFAIVMTLLVLEISVPELGEPVLETALRRELLVRLPVFLGFAVSFLILGIFWVAHHRQFHFIVRTDRTFVWISIITLLFVALIPFTTALLSRYPGSQTAIFVYAGVLLAGSLSITAQWWYATLRHRLVDHALDEGLLRQTRRWAFISPAGVLVIMGLSFVHPTLSLVGFAVLAAFFLVSPGYDRILGRLSARLSGSG